MAIWRVPRNGIQFVIAHDGEGSTGIDHAAHDMHRADLCWTSVDKVSDEDRLSFGVTPGAGRVAIAERAEKRLQLVRLPVDVPDDVISHVRQLSDNRISSALIAVASARSMNELGLL